MSASVEIQSLSSCDSKNVMVTLYPGADVPVGDDERLRGRPVWSQQQGRHRVRKHPGHLRVPQQVL